MSSSIQALVAIDGDIDRGLVDTLVAGEAGIVVLDYIDVGGSTASGYGVGDALIVACSDYTEQVQEYVRESIRQHPDRPVVLLSQGGENGYLREAFANGVEDVVTLSAGPGGDIPAGLGRQLEFALEKAMVKRRGVNRSTDSSVGRVICVLGLKGGTGKTLTTANMAVAMARGGTSVAVVDLDLQFGDVALTLGLAPERTVYDLVRSGGSLDAEKLRDYMVSHSSGADALLAPLRPDHASLINAPFVRELLRLLQQMYEYVLVDTPPNFTPEVISAIDVSTDILLVSMRDTLALKNSKLGLETLERMEYDRRQIRIVLNRANTKVGIDRQDVLAILGRDVDVLLPSHRDITRSVNQGRPIALDGASPAAQAFRELAELYLNDVRREKPQAAELTEQKAVTEDPVAAASPRRRLFARGA